MWVWGDYVLKFGKAEFEDSADARWRRPEGAGERDWEFQRVGALGFRSELRTGPRETGSWRECQVPIVVEWWAL